MANIRVILIDPVNRVVTEQFIDGSLESYYKLLDCQTIEAIYPKVLAKTGHFIFCDEEGTFKTPQHFFGITRFWPPLTGKACIVQHSDDGETESCSLTIAEATRFITFI